MFPREEEGMLNTDVHLKWIFGYVATSDYVKMKGRNAHSTSASFDGFPNRLEIPNRFRILHYQWGKKIKLILCDQKVVYVNG